MPRPRPSSAPSRRPPNRIGSVRDLPIVMAGVVPYVGYFDVFAGHRPDVPLAVGVVGRRGLHHPGTAEVAMAGAGRGGGPGAAVCHQVSCMQPGDLIVVRGVLASEGIFYGLVLALDYHAGDHLTLQRLSRERYYALAGRVCPDHAIDFPDYIRRPPARPRAVVDSSGGSPKGAGPAERGDLARCADMELVREVCVRGLFAVKDLCLGRRA